MRTQKNATTATAIATENTMPIPPTTPKPPQSFSITLTAPSAKLVLLAIRKPDGTAMTTATTIDVVTKKSQRGVTQRHANFEVARVAITKHAEAAQKLGWIYKPAHRVFAAKPDAFATIPAPPAVPVATKGRK